MVKKKEDRNEGEERRRGRERIKISGEGREIERKLKRNIWR